MSTSVETMAEWIDRQPWTDDARAAAHQFDKSAMSRPMWQAWLDKNYKGLTLAPREERQ